MLPSPADANEEEPEAPPKGVVPCPACGKRIRPSTRKVPHPRTAECRASVVDQAMRVRGLVPLDSPMGKVLKAAGVHVEVARGGWHWQEYADVDPSGRVLKRWQQDEQHDLMYVPVDALRVTRALARIRMSARERQLAILHLYKNMTAFEAMQAVIRLEQDDVTYARHVRPFVIEARRMGLSA